MKTREVLIEAKKLVREGWTQYVFAVDEEGRVVEPTESAATGFCALGAILSVTDGKAVVDQKEEQDPAIRYLDCAVSDYSDYEYIAEFNDCEYADINDILNVFDEAIYMCELNEGK